MTLIVEGNETLECLRAAAAFGFREAEFFNGRAIDLCSQKVAINKGMPSTDGPKDSLAFVSSAGPTDTVQSSLAVQMKATHDSAMVVLRKSMSAEWVEQAQMLGNLATKLLNVYARQAETLRKLQNGGVQIVRHVHVDNLGGQAVVTEQVNHARGLTNNVESQPQEQHLTCDGSDQMLGYDPVWYAVPAPSHEGEEALQSAQRQVDGP